MMKTLNNMILVALVFVTTFSYAKEYNALKMKTYAKLAVLEFDNLKQGQQLVIKDNKGIILYSETIKTNGEASKAFDLNQLKDGLYRIELNKDFEILINSFEVVNNKILFDKEEEQKIFKPFVKVNHNKLKISKLSFDSSPVEIEIFYGEELIYSESIQNEEIINRIYKLSKRSHGEYHVVVKSDERQYLEYFEL